jgi:hypothetical protein
MIDLDMHQRARGTTGTELALTTDFTVIVPWVPRLGGAIADQAAA